MGLPPREKAHGFKAHLKNTRPLAVLVAGLMRECEKGAVAFQLPLAGDMLRIKAEQTRKIFYVNASIGIECPLGRHTSLISAAGYSFFLDHAREYNGLMVNTLVRYRF